MIFSEHGIGTSSLRLNQKQVIPQYLSFVLNIYIYIFFFKIMISFTHEATPGKWT